MPGPQRGSRVYVAALTLDVLLGDVHSLKAKRGVVRPLVAELRRRYPGVAVAETGHLVCTGGPRSAWLSCPRRPRTR